MARGDDTLQRLVECAIEIMDLSDILRKKPNIKPNMDQLLRFGISPSPNGVEACGAESSKYFEHKMGIVLKELLSDKCGQREIRKEESGLSSMINPTSR